MRGNSRPSRRNSKYSRDNPKYRRHNPWKLSVSNVIGWIFGALAIFFLLTTLVTSEYDGLILVGIFGGISIFLLFMKAIWSGHERGGNTTTRR